MVYQLNTGNYNNLEKFRENILQPRSYFIPFAARDELEQTDIRTERFNSSRVAVLSGKWQFRYFARCTAIPAEFDTDEAEMDKIAVPSTWQRTGYEEPVYLNIRYPFQVEPPAIPQDCPAGVYVKKFALDEVSGNYTLTFLGVASCLDLFVNGKHVGYSEGSHNSAEFLINDLLQTGVNEIVAVVYKWCNGSYLECQDMFRENGIFRDVLLTRTGENSIYDFHVKTDRNENNTYNLSIMPVFKLADECTFHAWLMDGENQIAEISKTVSGVEACATTFNTLDVEQWSAELPKLYQLYLSLEKEGEVLEVIRRNVGFKTVAVKGPVFYFNGRNITIKGVNHHDSHPETGYVMRVEDLERDVRLMKEFNCNAVRTSHYPPDPIFLDLCDQYGLYVIDEADIETHGTGSIGRPNLLSNNEAWKEHYWDRVLRMYQRDKNHPAITMWSLGNESGGRKNQDYCYQNLKQLTAVPIHYEGVIHTSRIGYDVVSSMYGSPESVERIGRRKPVFAYPYLKCGAQLRKKPFFLCEYAHAMGVGAGSLEEYVQAFYKSDTLMGGGIWEFADHAVAHGDGPYRYTYCGDHGERIHDCNFCFDGMFYTYRIPHPGA
ncbi:MAG: beta-galactosidase, partial [Clostridiales bacterium]|nr:beta-galactosidase [Clostridiales bacterium]